MHYVLGVDNHKICCKSGPWIPEIVRGKLEFQTVGPATAKARRPYVLKRRRLAEPSKMLP